MNFFARFLGIKGNRKNDSFIFTQNTFLCGIHFEKKIGFYAVSRRMWKNRSGIVGYLSVQKHDYSYLHTARVNKAS